MLTVINDTHLGAQRRAGTTPASAQALTQFTEQQFIELLDGARGDLLILGDLFDTYNVPLRTVLFAFFELSRWLDMNEGFTLHLVPGNHDLSKDSSKMSSLQFLARLFEKDKRVVYYDKPGFLRDLDGMYVIPHLPNQDQFNLALEETPKCTLLFVHANYDNGFAAESDHSLNVSKEQAEALPCEQVVFAHEHHRRTELDGKVWIIGNQIPTSVADCLGSGFKSSLFVDDDKATWQELFIDVDDIFERIDWRNLAAAEGKHFIRVEGDASAQEAAAVIDTIAKFRRMSDAFVITNSVKIDGVTLNEEAATAIADAQGKIDILGAVLETLTEEEQTVVKTCLANA